MKNDGNDKCSKCGSDDISGIMNEWGFHNISENEVGVKVLVQCNECGNKWWEIYKFHGKLNAGANSII